MDGGKFLFKPIYKITDHKGLLSLLEKQHVNGAGGILMEDIEDSLPNAAKAFEVHWEMIHTNWPFAVATFLVSVTE